MPPKVTDQTDISSFPTCKSRRESQDTSPQSPDPNMEFLLEEAIAQASQRRLQNTLIEICGAENVGLPAMFMAGDLLLVDTRKVKYLSAEESSEEESGEEEEASSGAGEEAEDEISTQRAEYLSAGGSSGEGESGGEDGPSGGEVSSGTEEEEDQSNRTGKNKPGVLRKDSSNYNLCCQVARTAPKNASTSTASEIPRTKKFRLRYAICEGCKEEFDVSVNSKGDCDRWHNGDLEVDTESRAWKNRARESYESFDTAENRRKFPLAFRWSCCYGGKLTQGCRSTRHVEEDMPTKRLRYS